MLSCLVFGLAHAAPQRSWDEAHNLAQNVVSKLSLEDKVAVVSGLGWGNRCVGDLGKVKAIPNYNGLCFQDSPQGIRFANLVSAYPSTINLGATFDRDLMVKHGELQGKEFKGKGVNVALSPMMNMIRAPDAGRNWESPGADTYLVSEASRLLTRGIQSQGVIATAKHFIGNEQEHFRETSSSQIDDRTLHEVYLPPFEAAIEEGVAAIMCAYNLVNQTLACENQELLDRVLRKEMGFKGFVMTDWWATKKTVEGTASDVMMPGTDAFSSTNPVWGPKLLDAVRNGQVPASRLDDAVQRTLAAWYKLGQDTGFPETNFNSFRPNEGPQVNVQGNHKEHIRAVGAASSILLKNERNILPLKSGQKLAVIGEDAGPGNSTNNNCNDHACTSGTVAMGWGSGTAWFPYIITPFDGVKNRAEKAGSTVTSTFDDRNYELAKKLASEADVALVFVNANSGEGYLTVEGNAGDRNNLFLWRNGDQLIEEVASVSKNVVVVIHAPGAVDMNRWIKNPNVAAVIHALFPGQESGNAIADVLFGDVNPSGRLPFTINTNPQDYAALVMKNPAVPPGFLVPQVVYTEGLYLDYRFNDARNIKPLFEFGYGLSYTSFEYRNFRIAPTQQGAEVTFEVFNTGEFDGHEVPQLYLGKPAAAQSPIKELKDFDRKLIKKGSHVQFKMSVDAKKMRIWNTIEQRYVVVPGTYTIYIGSSSRDIKWQTTFTA
jgi:beta-glucosidase